MKLKNILNEINTMRKYQEMAILYAAKKDRNVLNTLENAIAAILGGDWEYNNFDELATYIQELTDSDIEIIFLDIMKGENIPYGDE